MRINDPQVTTFETLPADARIAVSSQQGDGNFDPNKFTLKSENEESIGYVRIDYTQYETIGLQYDNSVVGVEATINSTSAANQSCIVMENLNVGDVVEVSGKHGSSRCWSKVKDCVVVGIIGSTTVKVEEHKIVVDDSFDTLILNFRDLSTNEHFVKYTCSVDTFAEIEKKRAMAAESGINAKIDSIGFVETDISNRVQASSQYNTVVGSEFTPYPTSSAILGAAVISDLIEGETITISGCSGNARCWAKAKNGIVTEITASGTKYKTITIVVDDSFDTVVLNFREIVKYPPKITYGTSSIKIERQRAMAAEENLQSQISSVTATKSLKLLLIGSSFGVNTICNFPSLCDAAGIHITCCNMYKGSCTLEDVKTNIDTDNNIFTTRVWSSDNKSWTSSTYKNVSDVMPMDDWDVVILQRAAPGKEGGSDYWTDDMADQYEFILDYIRTHATNTPKIYFNSVFGRPLAKNGNNRQTQRDQALLIMSTAMEMQDQFGVEVLPISIALQNARETELSLLATSNSKGYVVPDLTGNEDHLDIGIGSYLLGCCVFEKICGDFFNMSILEVNHIPTWAEIQNNAAGWGIQYFTSPTERTAKIARYCAMCSVRNQEEVNFGVASRYPQ